MFDHVLSSKEPRAAILRNEGVRAGGGDLSETSPRCFLSCKVSSLGTSNGQLLCCGAAGPTR